MPTDEDYEALNIKDETKLETVKKAVQEFLENPNITVKDAAAHQGLPPRSLSHWLKSLGVTRAGRLATTETVIRKKELAALGEEAEKIATIAFGVGGPIARRYLLYIDYLLRGGKTLEMIGVDFVEWFQMKITVEARIRDLEVQHELDKMEIVGLNLKLEQANALGSSNFRYWLRAKMCDDMTRKVLRYKAYSVRIPHNFERIYHRELQRLDEDLPGLILAKITIPTEKIEELKKKFELPTDFLRECTKKTKRT